jgi:hypothetical protein
MYKNCCVQYKDCRKTEVARTHARTCAKLDVVHTGYHCARTGVVLSYCHCTRLNVMCMYCCFTLDAVLLAKSQYSEGPATGHLDTGFSGFPVSIC